ncbi:MAG: 5'-methylthioadenosine/adenosylhomocysteine nucleosidase [Oscillospiraceae bacterium]|nr:5'-methylthioadenosine/adenosylhomocysteine nucleosidase [Oscillospiraceae bacterium]
MKINGSLGIIGAMDSEVEHILSFLKGSRREKLFGLDFFISNVNTADIVLVKCGVGKVNAARCAQLLIDRFGAGALINTGIAGGVSPQMEVGDVVVATELCQHDFDITAFGHVKGYMSTGADDRYPTFFAADPVLSDNLFECAKKSVDENRIKRGRIASGDVFVSSAQQKKEIFDNFGAFCAEMEGAAIAQAAEYSGVPFAVLRVISDRADGKAAESFEKFEAQTAALSSEIIKSFIELI